MNTWTVTTLAILGATTQAEAQIKELSEDPTCRTCRIEYVIRDTLGSIDDPASPGPVAEAIRLSDGRFLVSSATMGPQVLVYGPGGDFQHAIGREGEGPGEMRSAPMLVRLPDDTIAMFDPRLGRISLFSSDGSFVRGMPIGMRAMSFAARTDGGFVIGIVGAPARQGTEGTDAAHLISSDGELEESFARVDPEQRSPFTMVRRFVALSDGRIWGAAMSGGRMEEWSANGELLRAFEIMNPDLQRVAGAREAGMRPDPNEKRPAQVSDLSVDSMGRIWIYLVVPDPESPPGPPGPGMSFEALIDTKILVLDPDKEVVVATGTFDGLIRPMGDGWVFDLVDTELGDRKVRVGTVRLEGLSGR